MLAATLARAALAVELAAFAAFAAETVVTSSAAFRAVTTRFAGRAKAFAFPRLRRGRFLALGWKDVEFRLLYFRRSLGCRIERKQLRS